MYHTTADDLVRIANDLGQISRKYTAGSQEMDQHITSLDNTASHLLYGGAKPWVGVASEAFQGAWEERRSRMQQASQLLTQAAQHLTNFAQTIKDNLPQIRMDQQLMQGPTSHMLAPDDQSSILSGESQAQNAIITALQTLNYQLETLAEEVRDCPEEQDESSPDWNQPYYNKSESGGAGETPETGGKTPEAGSDNPPGNWQIVPREEDPFGLPPSDSTPETFENNGFEASLYPDGELQIPWIDRLSQLLNLRSLVEWLGDRVQTIKAYVTDGFYQQYFATDELTQETMQRLNNMASTIGFSGSIQKDGARTWIIFTRTK